MVPSTLDPQQKDRLGGHLPEEARTPHIFLSLFVYTKIIRKNNTQNFSDAIGLKQRKLPSNHLNFSPNSVFLNEKALWSLFTRWLTTGKKRLPKPRPIVSSMFSAIVLRWDTT